MCIHDNVFSIKEASKRSGIHPSTIRLYEQIEAIPKIRRLSNNYRVYTETNVIQLKIAWLAFRFTWLSGPIRITALDIIARSVEGDFRTAEKTADVLGTLLDGEISEAKSAIRLVRRWLKGRMPYETRSGLRIKDTSFLTGVSADLLRGWEHNGLLKPRREDNRYRLYYPDDIRRIIVIKTLRKARYSMMSILRMFLSLEQGTPLNLEHIIDTPDDDDIVYATDRWLTTLKELKLREIELTREIREAALSSSE